MLSASLRACRCVRRHTNPFDGLKRKLRDRVEIAAFKVRRHTNPFDGLKLMLISALARCTRGSKAHKSVRRIETTPAGYEPQAPCRVRRHTNPFDGLKHNTAMIFQNDIAVRRHTNPFDGLKPGVTAYAKTSSSSKAHKSVRRIETLIASPGTTGWPSSKAHKSVRRIETYQPRR